jgi:hypothetical protein
MPASSKRPIRPSDPAARTVPAHILFRCLGILLGLWTILYFFLK